MFTSCFDALQSIGKQIEKRVHDFNLCILCLFNILPFLFFSRRKMAMVPLRRRRKRSVVCYDKP